MHEGWIHLILIKIYLKMITQCVWGDFIWKFCMIKKAIDFTCSWKLKFLFQFSLLISVLPMLHGLVIFFFLDFLSHQRYLPPLMPVEFMTWLLVWYFTCIPSLSMSYFLKLIVNRQHVILFYSLSNAEYDTYICADHIYFLNIFDTFISEYSIND